VVKKEDDNVLSWWPDETVQKPVTKPLYSLSSTSRADYTNFSLCSPRTGYSKAEHVRLSTPNRPKAAVGILPGYRTSESTQHVSEQISYEHQFNSRLNPSHPIRGKRHGCFVWKVVTPTRNKHVGEKTLNTRNNMKDVSYKLTNTDAKDDNIDAKSVVSSISNKTTKVVNNMGKKINANGIIEHFEPQIKNDTWSSQAVHPDSKTHRPEVAKQQKATIEATKENEDVFEMTDQEIKEVIKPSRPRRCSPPPHPI
jgi:hypothetical protein